MSPLFPLFTGGGAASSFRGARSANPESRDSGFSPSGCPGM